MIPFTPEFVERGYDNRAACPDHPQWFAEYARRSAAVLSRANVRRDLRYGRGAKETLDLFLPRDSARGTFVFLHGDFTDEREGKPSVRAHEEARRAAAIHARNGERLAKLRQQQNRQGEQL